MKIRWDPKKQRFPGFHGRYIVDSVRGQLRVRSWPRKRGTPKSSEVRIQNQWFKDANHLAKICEPSQQAQAIRMTLGTGLYPRDLLLKCMSGGIIDPITGDGRLMQRMRKVVTPVSWQGFMLRLTSDQNIGTPGYTDVTWPLPVNDSLGFWSVAAPTLITIPPGVTKMSFMSRGLSKGTYNGTMQNSIARAGGLVYGRADNVGNMSHGIGCFSGVVDVVAGQTFSAGFAMSANGILQGTNANTWFGGTVEEGG